MEVLCRAVDSALNQSFPVTEVIVVNDDPLSRESVDTALGGLDRVRVIHNEENSGACFSRNRGAEASSGDFIAFLDDDDEWESDKIEKQVRLFDDKTVFVYCTGIGLNAGGSSAKLQFIKRCTDDPLRDLLRTNCIGGCSFPLIDKKSFLACGGFDTGFQSSQDHDLWIRLACQGKIEYVDEPLVRYYFSSDSITRDFKKRKQGYSSMLKKHKKLFKRYPESARAYCYDFITVCVLKKHLLTALVFLFKSFFLFPHNLWMFGKLIRAIFKKRKQLD